MPEYNDDEIAEDIDLYFLAIFKTIDRQNEYLSVPTAAKLQEFNDHEGYLLQSESQLNIHSQRIVRRFREQIGYVGCMDTFIANRRSLDAVRVDMGFNRHGETKPTSESTSPFSPRDRNASFNPLLVGGLESGIAGQASSASSGRNEPNHPTYLKRDEEIDQHHTY